LNRDKISKKFTPIDSYVLYFMDGTKGIPTFGMEHNGDGVLGDFTKRIPSNIMDGVYANYNYNSTAKPIF
jgi:hypothetical protein